MTRLHPMARTLFHEHDDPLLAYLKEEGQRIEPQWCACLPLQILRAWMSLGT